MVKVALLVRLEVKPGHEQTVADFLAGALPIVEAEPATTTWYALRLGPSTFGLFDTFPDEAGSTAHLAGQVAAALGTTADCVTSRPHTNMDDISATKGHDDHSTCTIRQEAPDSVRP